MSAQHTLGTAADGKTELVQLPGHPLLVSAVEFNKAIAQRDELLAALKDAVAALDLYKAYGWSDRLNVIGGARAAIAKVEGGAV